ncbi:MAG: hypothetical protein ACIAXF_09140 [Phycisphaerales bacterium JB063]
MTKALPKRWISLCGAALLAGVGSAQSAPDAPATSPADQTPEQAPEQAGLVVYDLVIMRADLFGQKMNDPSDFETTLFNDSPRRRPVSESPNNTPMPLGLITLAGSIPQPAAMRIGIAQAGGQFLGHWPKGVAGRDYLAWYDIRQVETPAGRRAIDADHWLAPLRDGEGPLCFNTRNQVDRFFCYDATFDFSPALKVEGSAEDGYRITGQAPAGTQHLLIIRNDPAGWRIGTLDAAPFTGPVEMQRITDPSEGLVPILAKLHGLGYPETQTDTANAILRESALGDASMSLIYLVDEQTLDTILPLTLVPEPTARHRIGIVIVKNVEPDIAGTVAELIQQLGDDHWAQRNAAQRALVEMDRAAIGLVRENTDHTDPEIAYRIEQIIAAYDERHKDDE